jgi:arsenite-transporting ATPase
VIVVDCAPTGETLRLLSFPDVARWWLDKVFGREQQLLAAARPLARTFLDVSLPEEAVFGEVSGSCATWSRWTRSSATRRRSRCAWS